MFVIVYFICIKILFSDKILVNYTILRVFIIFASLQYDIFLVFRTPWRSWIFDKQTIPEPDFSVSRNSTIGRVLCVMPVKEQGRMKVRKIEDDCCNVLWDRPRRRKSTPR